MTPVDLRTWGWLNEPAGHRLEPDALEIVTAPGTDLWQRSYYGFRADNAPALLLESPANFTFTARASFEYVGRFNQCGLAVYGDSDHWFKASVEHENADLARLGSVVTNGGYSDWATRDIAAVASIWFRLSRRGPDFLLESSFDGEDFGQMRIFHLHNLGETTLEMGRSDPPAPPERAARFGLYACSPTDASFRAVFSDLSLDRCRWPAHREE